MQVRPATRADVEAVYDLHVASIRAFGPESYDERQVTAWAETEFRGPDEHYPVGDPGHHFVVARVDRPQAGPQNRAASETNRELAGALAGFGHLAVDAREVQAVYVHPEHAQVGVGSALLAHLEGVAYGLDLSELDLTASLNAVPFYEAAGYERVREDVHETSGGGVEAELDVVVMRKVLPPTPEL
jgi:putative acetyltransferase